MKVIKVNGLPIAYIRFKDDYHTVHVSMLNGLFIPKMQGECRYLEYEDLSRLATRNFNSVVDRIRSNNRTADKTYELYAHIFKAYDRVDFSVLTIRGLYYRLISYFGYPKTDSFYAELQRNVTAMRRLGLLPYEWITDESRSMFNLEGYASQDAFLEDISSSYRKNYWLGSPYKLTVLVEKRSLLGILQDTCSHYGVSLASTNGNNSITAWYQLAMSANEDKHNVVLILTDYDTAGLNMHRVAIKEMKIHSFPGEVIRVGLTKQHISMFDLITRIDKKDSSMEACELDALEPQDLRDILSEAIEQYMPARDLEMLKIIEEDERESILDMVGY